MSLYIASINSGSNGNCYYIGNNTDAVLVDAGLTCRETEKRMRRIGLSMDKVRALFVSHEHGDHIKGIQVIAEKYKLPVYITARTLQCSRMLLRNVMPIVHDSRIDINSLTITAFSKAHDAIEPLSFTIAHNGTTVGVFTDIGIVCNNLQYHFSQCHAAFLESNYDDAMLRNGRYPIHLQNRIRGGHGHLSNDQALALFNSHRPAHMSHLLLAHLSKENNDPGIVLRMFKEHAQEVKVIVASRYEESPLYHINANASVVDAAPIPRPEVWKQSVLF